MFLIVHYGYAVGYVNLRRVPDSFRLLREQTTGESCSHAGTSLPGITRGHTRLYLSLVVLINWNAPRGATWVICFVQALSHLMRSYGRQGQACGRRRRSINGVKAQPCCKQRRHNDI